MARQTKASKRTSPSSGRRPANTANSEFLRQQAVQAYLAQLEAMEPDEVMQARIQQLRSLGRAPKPAH